MSTPANLNFGWDPLIQLLTVNGGVLFGPVVGPYFSLPNTGQIYYDGPSQRLKASENGAAPVNLLTGGGGGSAVEFVQNNHVTLPQENKISFDGVIIRGTDNSGAGATDITIQQADATHSGYLSSTDWNTFNAGGAGGVPATRNINTTAPLTGGGNLSTDRTLAITQSDATHNGFLSSTDWNTFNNKGNGTVTSVAFTGDGVVYNASVPGSPITASGTFAPTLHTQTNNTVFAGPNGGGPLAPTFRSLVNADLPTSGVTAGSYTNTNLTVNAQGIITSASNGSGSSGSDKSVRVRTSSNQSIPNATFTSLTFDVEVFDTDNMHDNVTNNTRLTANTAGKYWIHGIVNMNLPTNCTYALAIVLNGTTVIAQTQHFVGSLTLDDSQEISTLFNLAVNDFVELQAFQNGGGAFNSVANGVWAPVFEAARQPG